MATEKPTKTTRAKKPTVEAIEVVEFNVNKLYKLEAQTGARYLKAGKIYEVTGEIAKELVKKGFAKLV
jgi:hypothetical protein